jgi:uncharacterized membrane protein
MKWIMALLILNTLDMISTLIGVKIMGMVEMNPIMSSLLQLPYAWAFIIIKLIGSGLFYAVRHDIKDSNIVKIFIIILGLVVISNFTQIIWRLV